LDIAVNFDEKVADCNQQDGKKHRANPKELSYAPAFICAAMPPPMSARKIAQICSNFV